MKEITRSELRRMDAVEATQMLADHVAVLVTRNGKPFFVVVTPEMFQESIGDDDAKHGDPQ